jgi:hypothetical protein
MALNFPSSPQVNDTYTLGTKTWRYDGDAWLLIGIQSGFSGFSGYSGYSGAGESGFSGYSGTSTSGFSGISGYSGYSGGAGSNGPAGSASPKAISIADPTSAEDVTFFFTPIEVTVTIVEVVLRGSATPSVTLSVRYNSDRSAAGTAVVNAQTVTNTTTGTAVTLTSDVVIPANSFVWLETSAVSGTVDELSVTLIF